MAIMLITHDLGVIAEMADDVVVMYLGRVVEEGPVDDIFHKPEASVHAGAAASRSPARATSRAASCRRSAARSRTRMTGRAGCLFHPRCPSFMPGTCDQFEPELIHVGDRQDAACFLYGGVPERWDDE